ncbi:hypothetical protein K431DRAFT_288445 [Polychaeton citri CBS 116435]|uniref:Uncharacterized protein n=1 Tax=Polychaeton citri CBS 116435 TaxID=1314669 RepID=A0A9P4UJ44_9PEZI|nr:hypothetical protein K431DRAFT_288445 [Polychaeton citri CBS 116435]
MTPHPVQSATEQTFGVETASLDSLQSTKLRRVDSRMDLHYALPIKTDWGKADLQIVSLPSSRRSSTHMYKANPKPSPQHHMESAQSATSYLFSVVDPSAPVDKEDLRRRRKHVMDVYNERGAPSHQVGNKRKRPAPVLLDPSILPSTSKLDPEGSLPKENPRCTPRDRGTSTCTSTSASRNGKLTMSQDEPAPRFVPVDNGMVVPMAQAAPEAPVYLNTIWQHVPFPLSPLGRQLNAFNVLPDLQGQMVNIYKLKHECGAHFGSGGIVKHWLPSLMQARHAFLSTICISAAHDEIMAYHLSPNRSLPRTDITVRMTIRSEMMRLINMCISDPQLQAHDTTIIAVLQILTSEIMDEGTSYLKVHAKGLGELIKQRGGLNELGIKVGGGESLIALVIVVTMYLIAVLRETEVEPTYRQFCDRIHQTTHWPRRDSVAQSPLVSLGKLAYTSQNCRSQFKETVKVLDQVEGLMHAFSENFMTRVSQDDQCRMFSVIQSFDQRCRDDRSSQDSRRYDYDYMSSYPCLSLHKDSL